MSRTYENHKGKIITEQLGLSFAYDATQEDDWMMGNAEWHESILVPQAPLCACAPVKNSLFLLI